MVNLTTEYKKKLLFFFFYISQTELDITYSAKNKLFDTFNRYLTAFELGNIGKKTFFDCLSDFEAEIEEIEENGKNLILTDLGRKRGFTLEGEIDQIHLNLIMEFFDIDIELNLYKDIEEGSIIYPIPPINEAYGIQNFYWFYRGNDFTRKYKKFYSNFLEDPWKKTFGLIYGASNSGKTSFLQFLTAFNQRRVLRNSWVDENKEFFDFKRTQVEYQNKISTISELDSWLSEIRWKIQKQCLKDSNDKRDITITIKKGFINLKSLDNLLENSRRKLLLILDQAEYLLEDLVKNKNNSMIFVEEFLCDFPHLENIALVLSISNEYYTVLKNILNIADRLEIKFEEFIVNELDLELVDTIIQEIRKTPFTKRKLHFKPILIKDNQIDLIKKAVQHGNSFLGTELMIILNYLRMNYGKESLSEVIISELLQETYINILSRWIIEKIEERIDTPPNTEKWWEFSLLKQLVTISPNIAAPCPLNIIEDWYDYQIQLFFNGNIPSLERIVRNLANDGLISFNDNSIQFKHQYVLNTFKDNLNQSELALVHIKTLWHAETELTTIPRLGPFKDAFEHINSFPHLLYAKKNREKLAYGLVSHHLDVDVSIPSQNTLDTIIVEILNQLTDFELEDILSLFKTLNENREAFFIQYRMSETRTWKLLGNKWISILDSEFNPNVLSEIIKEVAFSDNSLANDLSKIIFTVIQDNFLGLFSERKRVLILFNNLSVFQPFLIELIQHFPWKNAREIEYNTLKGILQSSSHIIKQIIEIFRSGKEQHQITHSDEEKLVKKSFVYNFFHVLCKYVQWENIHWYELQIEEFDQFLSLFGGFLEFPEEIMKFNWSNYLEKNWIKDPDKILLLLSKRYNFTSNYLIDWLEGEKFPKIENFVNCGKLGLLNYFLRRGLAWNIRDKAKIYDFLNQAEFSKKKLIPLFETVYYPVLHDFQKIMMENHPKKLDEFKELIEDPNGNRRHLNRYHRSLKQIFNEFTGKFVIDVDDFINNTASVGKEYTWYWPFLTLPSIFDLVLIIENLNPEHEEEFINQILTSIKRNPESWNNILDVEFYIQSFGDFYPGNKQTSYLNFNCIKEEQTISSGRKEPTFEQLNIIHYLGLTFFFYQISKSQNYHPILELLVEKTHIIEYIFTEESIRKIPWKQQTLALSFSQQLFDFGLFFSFSRNEIDMHKLEHLIRNSLYYTPIEAFYFLLKTGNPVVFSITSSIDLFSLTSLIEDPSEIRRKNPEKFSEIIIQIVNGKKSFSDLDKLWTQLFGLTKPIHPISQLKLDSTTFESLVDHPTKDIILEKTPWSLYLPKMTDEELKYILKLSKTRLFQKSSKNSLIDSFIEGILEVFTKWYQIACDEWLNRLVSITDLIYLAKRIDRQKDKQLFIKKLSQELKTEDWYLLLINNLDDEEPIREIMNFLETIEEHPKLNNIQLILIDTLIFDENLIIKYFKTFTDAIMFLDWLFEKYHRKKTKLFNIQPFLRVISDIPLFFDSKGFHGSLGAIRIPIQSKSIQKPEVMNIFVKLDFFNQMKNYIVNEVNMDDYFFTYLPEIYIDMSNLQGKSKGREFIKNILEDIQLEKLFITQRYFYRFDMKGLSKANEEFIKILVETESFNSIDWTRIGNHKSWFDYYSFIKFLDTSSELLTKSILQNPSFWRIKWVDFIKSWLLNCDKRIFNYFKFLNKFNNEKYVNKFLCSSELLECPWENCKLKISQSKEEPSLLSVKEFKEIIGILEKYNSEFIRLKR